MFYAQAFTAYTLFCTSFMIYVLHAFLCIVCLRTREGEREGEREGGRAFTKKESVGREIKEKRKQNSF